MLVRFYNESWLSCNEKEYFKRILKYLRYHKSLERTARPTTHIVFLSCFADPSMQQYFEDSSRDFKTYNSVDDLCEFFPNQEDIKCHDTFFKFFKLPDFFFRILETVISNSFLAPFAHFLLSKDFVGHLNFRLRLKSLSNMEVSQMVLSFFRSIGLANFSKLTLVVSQTSDLNQQFAVRFLCHACNDDEVRKNIPTGSSVFPFDSIFVAASYDKRKNSLHCRTDKRILDSQHKLILSFGTKAEWVSNRIQFKTSDIKKKEIGFVVIVGRRFLTKGFDFLNQTAFLQSYDHSKDEGLVCLKRIIKVYLAKFAKNDSEVLVVIENYPNKISYMISQDDELKTLLHGNRIALACIEPESQDIYTFEGTQFIQQILKHVY